MLECAERARKQDAGQHADQEDKASYCEERGGCDREAIQGIPQEDLEHGERPGVESAERGHAEHDKNGNDHRESEEVARQDPGDQAEEEDDRVDDDPARKEHDRVTPGSLH